MLRFEKISKTQYNKDTILSDEVRENSYNNLKLPKRATKYSAGYDIFSPIDFVLYPGETINLPTGIRVALDPDKFLMIVPRSGLGFKYGIYLRNTTGIIDADYYNSDNEGHIWVKLTYPNDNLENLPLQFKAGDAICQGIIMKYFTTDDDATENVRNGGLGSTSKNN